MHGMCRFTDHHAMGNFSNVWLQQQQILQFQLPRDFWFVQPLKCMQNFNGLRGRVAELVQCLAQKPGTMLMQVQFPGVTKDFSHRVNFQAESYSVHADPVCNTLHASTSVAMFNPTQWQWQLYHCLDTQKYCTHWYKWAALLSWLV